MSADAFSRRLMLTLGFTTGILDAATYLGLHGVFTANMTGNVIFVSLGLAGESEIPLLRAGLALGGFAVGAFLAGRLQRKHTPTPNADPLVAVNLLIGSLLMVGVTLVLALMTHSIIVLDSVTVVLALVMGAQAMAARRVGVPDVTTVVVTSTLAGLMGDNRWAGGASPASATWRRFMAVATMAVGAVLGAVLLQWSLVAALVVASTVNVCVALTAVARWWRARPRRPQVGTEGTATNAVATK